MTQQGTVRVQGPVRGPLVKSPPATRSERERGEPEEREHPSIKTPIDPTVRTEDIRPTNPETVVRLIPEHLLESPQRRPAAPQAPGSFTLFRNSAPGDMPALPGATPGCGAISPCDHSPYEPSVGVNGRTVFYTTNNYAAVSGDRGQNFTYINPFDNFPANSIRDDLEATNNANGGFAGDQYVYYVRTHGLMCWLLQYRDDGATNRQRLAIARSQADVLNNTWLFYDFSPATFNLTDTRGIWLDFPDMAVSDNFLYLTTNVFTISPQVSRGSVIWRIPLTQLVQGVNLNFGFFNDTTHQSLRLTHGAHDTMYWGTHNTNTQMRVYRWPENGAIAFDDVIHSAYNASARGSHIATCAGGTNYLSFDDDRILAAWVANGVIGFMWDAAQGGGFARPYVEVLRFDESNHSLLTQGQIFSGAIAFAYPSAHPNDRGHLGGTIAFGCGGGSGNPGVAAWIADDFNNNMITPLETLGVASGNRAEGRWGDYFTTRIYSPYVNTWVGTGFALDTPTPSSPITRDHRFVWFGRERDAPPPTNVIFVSQFNTTGYEDGSLLHPYNTVGEGHFAAMPGDVISIAPANYNEPQTLSRPSRIERLGATGTVKIGQP